MKFRAPTDRPQFNERVWELARKIPRGRVATYGQLAMMLAPPAGVDSAAYQAFGPRWVGGAMAGCPDDVPWQRVINSQGRISQRPGAEKQRQLLEGEGVVFAKDRVDFKKYGWSGSDRGGQAEQKPLL